MDAYIENDIKVPGSALLQRERKNRYGSVCGLDEEELADPDELERQVMVELFAPVLALPVRRQHGGIQPNMDESGAVDWGAFGTVDFERIAPAFDKVRYKAEKAREKLRSVLIMLSIVKDRLPGKAKYLVLKYLRMGVIELDHIVNSDMLAVARYTLQAKKLRDGIQRLREVSRRREERGRNTWLDSLG